MEKVVKITQRERTRIILQYLDQKCMYGYGREKPGLITGNQDPFGVQVFQMQNVFIPHTAVNPDLITILLRPLFRISAGDLYEIAKIEGYKGPYGKIAHDKKRNLVTLNCNSNNSGDTIEVSENGLYWDANNGSDGHISEGGNCSLAAYQYCYEKGYALPWKEWTVKQLEEFGIYKLIEK